MPVDLTRALESLKEDFDATEALVNEIYNKYFSANFERINSLNEQFRDKSTPISDEALEDIITVVPLDLYMISNQLSQLQHQQEITKLKIKQRKKSNIPEEDLDIEYQLMSIVYSSVISRVEHQITFSKELIMGAKKIWDARKHTVSINPIKDKYIDLPDYSQNSNDGGTKHVPIF